MPRPAVTRQVRNPWPPATSLAKIPVRKPMIRAPMSFMTPPLPTSVNLAVSPSCKGTTTRIIAFRYPDTRIPEIGLEQAMLGRHVYRVSPMPNGKWSVSKEGESAPREDRDTRESAVTIAAADKPSKVLVEDTDGTLADERLFGVDPGTNPLA